MLGYNSMKTDENLVKKFAQEIAERVSRKIVLTLQKITSTLSGDDSELNNAWDEICVQVQHEDSFFWDAYDETVRSVSASFIEKLQTHEQLALWFQTDQGWDWNCDHGDDSDVQPPVLVDDIVEYVVQEYVYSKADTWTNERIRTYLKREHLV